MSMENRLPLFVFGTLRQGHVNHHYLAGHYARMTPAILPGYRRLHPLMIACDPRGEVDGELYHLIPETYDSTLAGCDELEEIPPGQLVGHEYQRKLVTVQTAEGPVQAWAYVQPEG
ncbi:gamma-glutamylcyclotransferase [bacterium]|nr:gamma-glutamylcyclotransferase [bacterium]